ncbi:hypothetical protein [Tsukamurella pseudospumae]|uniref:Uncharacterized protein n=1 Tax=Tsukamurella pseudospumae TaxID=239498 RepID=A0A138AV54_9ACTN|nr:hypothetical protein [Tsukamurella pseudospumae]KXP14341.1 hypothetical protein AXK60_20535 [Tsukamurella pseudospumae]
MATTEQRIDNTLFLARFVDPTLTREDITFADGATRVRGQLATEYLTANSRIVPNDPIPEHLVPEVERIVALGRKRGVEVDRDFFYVLGGRTLLLDGTDPEERIEEMVAEAKAH